MWTGRHGAWSFAEAKNTDRHFKSLYRHIKSITRFSKGIILAPLLFTVCDCRLYCAVKSLVEVGCCFSSWPIPQVIEKTTPHDNSTSQMHCSYSRFFGPLKFLYALKGSLEWLVDSYVHLGTHWHRKCIQWCYGFRTLSSIDHTIISVADKVDILFPLSGWLLH